MDFTRTPLLDPYMLFPGCRRKRPNSQSILPCYDHLHRPARRNGIDESCERLSKSETRAPTERPTFNLGPRAGCSLVACLPSAPNAGVVIHIDGTSKEVSARRSLESSLPESVPPLCDGFSAAYLKSFQGQATSYCSTGYIQMA